MKHIFQLASKKSVHQRGTERGLIKRIGRDPFVDWAGMVAISAVIAVVLVVMGVYLYLDLDQRLTQSVSAPSPDASMTIDTRGLGQVIKEFDSRGPLRDSLLRGYTGPSDPSI